MSGLLAGRVWHSGLPAHLKPLAAALADEARDDGSNCRPAVAFIAWKLGADRRTVQRGMSTLRDMGVLRATCHGACQKRPGEGHGRASPVAYVLDETALPTRESWSEVRDRERSGSENKGGTVPLLSETKGGTGSTKGDICIGKGRRPTFGVPYSVDPSEIDPSDPDLDPSARADEISTHKPHGLATEETGRRRLDGLHRRYRERLRAFGLGHPATAAEWRREDALVLDWAESEDRSRKQGRLALGDVEQ